MSTCTSFILSGLMTVMSEILSIFYTFCQSIWCCEIYRGIYYFKKWWFFVITYIQLQNEVVYLRFSLYVMFMGRIVVCARFLITGEMRHLALFRDIHYFEINYIYQNLIVFTFLNRDVKRIYWPKGLLVICKSWAQDQFEL